MTIIHRLKLSQYQQSNNGISGNTWCGKFIYISSENGLVENINEVNCEFCKEAYYKVFPLEKPVQPLLPPSSSTITKTENTVIKTETNITRQDLEPNYCEIWTGPKNQIYFKVRSSKNDLSLAVDETVEQYNRLATSLHKPKINLDEIIIPGQIVSEEKIKEDSSKLAAWEVIAESKRSKNKSPLAFGNRLRKFRRMKGIKIVYLASKLNEVSKEDLLKIELNESPPPSSENILLIAEILNLNDKQWAKLNNSAKRDV